MKIAITAAAASEIQEAGHTSTAGMVDTYPGEDGRLGIDACLPERAGYAMLADILRAEPVNLYVCQMEAGGNIAIDVQVSAAAKILAKAKRMGVTIRH